MEEREAIKKEKSDNLTTRSINVIRFYFHFISGKSKSGRNDMNFLILKTTPIICKVREYQ